MIKAAAGAAATINFSPPGASGTQAADAISAARTVRFSKGLNAFQSCLRDIACVFRQSIARHRFDVPEGIRARCSIEISFAPPTVPAVIAARSPTSMGETVPHVSGNDAQKRETLRIRILRFGQGKSG